MNNRNLIFPSGRSVSRCRQDAKELVKKSKDTTQPLILADALDIVSNRNGVKLPWAKAINKLKRINSHNNTALHKKSLKEAQVHLLGHALEMLIHKKYIDMDNTEGGENGHLECSLLDQKSVVLWKDGGYGEIRLSVWWNYNKSKHPQHVDGGYKDVLIFNRLSEQEKRECLINNTRYVSESNLETYTGDTPLAHRKSFKEFVGVCCSTWVERRAGKYLQTDTKKRICESYVRSVDREALISIPDCVSKNFSLNGKFHF